MAVADDDLLVGPVSLALKATTAKKPSERLAPRDDGRRGRRSRGPADRYRRVGPARTPRGTRQERRARRARRRGQVSAPGSNNNHRPQGRLAPGLTPSARTEPDTG